MISIVHPGDKLCSLVGTTGLHLDTDVVKYAESTLFTRKAYQLHNTMVFKIKST